MSAIVKNIQCWPEYDEPDQLSSFFENLVIDSDIPDTTNSNVNNNKNLDDKHFLTKDKLLSENDKGSVEKVYLLEEEKKLVSNKGKETVISLKQDTNIEVSNVIKTELSSDSSSDSDSDDSDLLTTRGKEKTKKKSSSRKLYDRPTHSRNYSTVNITELNQHSLHFLSSGYIVQDNVVDNFQSSQAQFGYSNSFFSLNPNDPIQSVDSANFTDSCTDFTDSSINSPFNASSPESGYDTQSSEVFSPSPPNVQLMLNRNIVEEDEEIPSYITESIFQIEESLENIEPHNGEFHIPGIDLDKDDFIEEFKLFLQSLVDQTGSKTSETIDSELRFNEDSETLRNEIPDLIPLDSLSDDFETESNSQSISSDTFVSESEFILPASKAHKTDLSSFSVKPINIKPINIKPTKQNDIAKGLLRECENFNEEKYLIEIRRVIEEIRRKKQCIDIEQQTQNSKRTNLHNAVLSSNIERIYCIVEIQKKVFNSIQFEINFRDMFEKTALNYAEELKLPLVVDYLKENLAVKSV